ncbi:MAG: phosphatidylserine decarboxylase [Candidatus Fischerbacteria bacterium RBG_13_37_8]|uniref:Phosphatidylserine decarboxylase n=1 Tax=Candidatus Fischerbacteria bacterium RBG_13_37_8 TaxID=1817863 RepID=A0A1F5VRV5_9BACT|nr:MAG: phosphatidylserine decarboxylase [Candidatus Fischerbacteria bacterium RBG_13_37_8]
MRIIEEHSLNKLAVPFLIAGGVLAIFFYFIKLLIGSLVFLLFICFIFYFFRDPKREITAKDNQIISPADGKIVGIEEYEKDGQNYLRISIFLSIFDVHINRAPLRGLIKDVQYKRGKFYAAFNQLATGQNEQNVIFIENEHGNIILKQIAGILARRILFWKQTGDTIITGEKIGMIILGSRTELEFPAKITLQVKVKDKVHAGISILGVWNEEN